MKLHCHKISEKNCYHKYIKRVFFWFLSKLKTRRAVEVKWYNLSIDFMREEYS